MAVIKEGGISAWRPPTGWDKVTPVFDEAIQVGEMPDGTEYPVTEKQWTHGYDPSVAAGSGKAPTDPQASRRGVAAFMIKWCITIAQKDCYICVEPLWPLDVLREPSTWSSHAGLLDFDHCVPRLKSSDYSTKAWTNQPYLAMLTLEKRMGCFCHKKCHYKGNNWA